MPRPKSLPGRPAILTASRSPQAFSLSQEVDIEREQSARENPPQVRIAENERANGIKQQGHVEKERHSSPVRHLLPPSAHGDSMHLVGYVRVSTEEQERSGLGVEAQREAIRREAARRGWTYELIEDLGCSGKHVNPQLRRALDLLRSGQFDGLMVAKLDRLARSVRHASAIIDDAIQQEWSLVVLDNALDLTTPGGRAMANMLATFAELERDLISTRTKEALAARSRRGEVNGRRSAIPPTLLRRIVTAREDGASFSRIAADLTAERHLSPTGLPAWQESTVRRAYASATAHTSTTSKETAHE